MIHIDTIIIDIQCITFFFLEIYINFLSSLCFFLANFISVLKESDVLFLNQNSVTL